jgi:nucleotide sugar dehydrogenase
MNTAASLLKSIKKKKSVVGIIGIGYVGDALGLGSSSAGYTTLGFTRTPARAEKINKRKNPNYIATVETTRLSECDIFCICVPTPVHEDKRPDLQPLIEATTLAAKYIHPGSLVIVESTIAPGTTRKVVLPILKTTGLQEEKDFFLSFSPERVDPGNKKFGMKNTPRVVSGLSETSTKLVKAFYDQFVDHVVPVSSLEAAEMAKILENTFRLVNISLVNELLPYSTSIGVDLWEVIHASATKPYGFMPHFPGPGIGGHCILHGSNPLFLF